MKRWVVAGVLVAGVAGIAVWTGRAPVPSGTRAQPATPLRDGGALSAGVPVTGRVVSEPDGRTTFTLDVPDDVTFVEIRITKAPTDLDLHVTFNQPVDDIGASDLTAATESHNESVRLSVWDDVPLEAGTYYVDVVPSPRGLPRVNGRPVDGDIAFEIVAETVRSGEPARLSIGRARRGTLSRENGFGGLFVAEAGEGMDGLRIDLADASTSLELYVSREGPVAFDGNSEIRLDGIESRKFLWLDAHSDPPLESGPYYIAVVDRYQSDAPVDFTLIASGSNAPPDEWLTIPPWEPTADPWETALRATVELITPAGGGSGVLVDAKGLIVTNRHVIEDTSGGLPGENGVIVAVAVDPRRPPVDMYRGTVIHADKPLDLAIVEITQGYYGQPLPTPHPFPFVPIREGPLPRIGEPLTVAGYPWIGGTTGRVTLTVAKGVVSGFEYHGSVAMMKTDADFHPGHSGGPVLDDQHRLVGIASETVEEELAAGKIGFARPIESLPAEWRKRIGGR